MCVYASMCVYIYICTLNLFGKVPFLTEAKLFASEYRWLYCIFPMFVHIYATADFDFSKNVLSVD